MKKTWLISGSASGLGREIALAALAAGDNVVAGARRPEELDGLVTEHPEQVLPVTLDVRFEGDAQKASHAAVERYGRIDVLVNNAGYGYFAPFEQISSKQFRDVVETCFFGVVHLTRAVLPYMREQRSGCILQVSSIGGRLTMPGNSPYHAAKWAVGGFSDSLVDEVAPFGVEVCTIEPGGIRTNWAQRAGKDSPALLPEYEDSVGPLYRMRTAIAERAEGDPKKIARVILALAYAKEVPRRLILGRDAEQRVQLSERVRSEEAAKYRELTLSTTFD